MGYMNIAALKHDQIDPAKRLDVPEGIYIQSHHSPSASFPLASISQQEVSAALGSEKKHRFSRIEHVGQDGIFTCNPWHTSASGVLILTSDYIINLMGYQPFGDFPLPRGDDASLEALEALTGETLVEKMAADYRKGMIKARNSAKRNGMGHMVTNRKLVTHDTAFEQSLPEAIVADSDLTGFVWINYDCLHEDRRPEDEHLSGQQWQALIREGRDTAPGFGRYPDNRISDYSSLGGITTLGQQDILVIQYSHLAVWHAVRLTRSRRTPPEALYPEHLRYNDDLGTVLSMEYPLMREFFDSQGIRIQL